MLGLCSTIVKLQEDIGSCRGRLAWIKAVPLDIGCSVGVVFLPPAIGVLLRLDHYG